MTGGEEGKAVLPLYNMPPEVNKLDIIILS